jgi:dynein light chain Tctex-type 1/3
MIEALKSASTGSSAPYKFAVSSTIIQNGTSGEAKRGMNSSIGAFWNGETDGMWSYKYESGEKVGLDVVINVIWMAYTS